MMTKEAEVSRRLGFLRSLRSVSLTVLLLSGLPAAAQEPNEAIGDVADLRRHVDVSGAGDTESDDVNWQSRSMSEVRQAAEQGDAGAQLFLGMSYAFGYRVPKDETRATVWLKSAAEQEKVEAQFLLGTLYVLARNLAQGARWLERAASQGHGEARNLLSEVIAVIQDMAEAGHAEAQLVLGMMHERGSLGAQKNDTISVKWYRAAAEQGQAMAQYRLGARYATGMGVSEDYAQAAQWYHRAAEKGVRDAQAALGTLYSSGMGVPKDGQEAVAWYRKAAEQGHVKSQALLGLMYSQGTGVPKDYVLAYAWLNLSAAAEPGVAGPAREQIAAMMTQEQVAEAQRLSRELNSRVANAEE